jgi:hypothetical protein
MNAAHQIALNLQPVDWLQLLLYFLTLSLMAVGGAIATAPDMHRFLVDGNGWLTEAQFTSSIAIAQAARAQCAVHRPAGLEPGPERGRRHRAAGLGLGALGVPYAWWASCCPAPC